VESFPIVGETTIPVSIKDAKLFIYSVEERMTIQENDEVDR
jgi:hypothetical protein